MNTTYLNVFILGVILLFGAVFWTYGEINRSNSLVDNVTDPVDSSFAGRDAAIAEFSGGYYHFMDAFVEGDGWKTLGVTEEELAGKYSEFVPPNLFFCGFGLRHEQFKLDLDSHRVTEHYALAFNAKLKQLIDEE